MINVKLKTAITLGLLLTGVTAFAERGSTVDVDVEVESGQGKVMIVKDVDGKLTTINESFDATGDEDMQAKIDALLAAHGVDVSVDGAEVHKEVVILNQGEHTNGDHPMMFIKKSNNINVDLDGGVAKVIIKKDNDGQVEVIEESIEMGDDVNLDQLIEDLMNEHGIDADAPGVHKKIIKLDRHAISIDDDKPRLGFMASVNDEGWDVISVVPESGAADAGIASGDVIVAIDGVMTGKEGMNLSDFSKNDYQSGDFIEVMIERGGESMAFDVEAKVINSPDILMQNVHQWISKDGGVSLGSMKDAQTFEYKIDGKNGQVMTKDINLGGHQVHIMTTDDSDAYFFSNGKMNQWLGKKHHFSTVTKDLGQYFGVDSGVLVLEVDVNNKLGLKDGDVIQSINGEVVTTPKDVVKKMSALKNDSQVEIEIYRNKEKLYLAS